MTAELSNQRAPQSNAPPGPLAAQEISGNRAGSVSVYISVATIQIDKYGNIAVDGKCKVTAAGDGNNLSLAWGQATLQVSDGKVSIK
jgi:hypothetical protein